jgi:hypothetical protein
LKFYLTAVRMAIIKNTNKGNPRWWIGEGTRIPELFMISETTWRHGIHVCNPDSF